MVFALHVIFAMSSAFFNPSFAFSSHFDSDGAPLSELSWPSSLAVVAVSFSGLFTIVFLMLACLCCRKGDIRFKEFENPDGDEYQAALATPSSQNGPEVYILPLTEVSLPVSKQPGRSIQLLQSSELGRHSLLYLKEIGNGWFGKVLLGEVHAGLSSTSVVVKELNASASVQDQMHFLEEVQPYRSLQHPALLQCLAQSSEVTPYLLVMEFCPLGDIKSYLSSCRGDDSEPPDALILQRMACDVASGLLYLHRHDFIHSDLALRNCQLTSEMSVKIGDYGLSHSRFKEDYYVTQDQIWVPLRWIAPELIDEVHGNVLVVDQTKSSNIWSLGVTMWELFELGNQPYRLYSDRQVLTYAVKEQQLKLGKPELRCPLVDRWYEVMQFCWLQPDLRPSSEEVHLLVTYLCAKGSSEAEEDFEQRWNALRPNLLASASHAALLPPPAEAEPASASSSFPLLENFSDGFQSDSDDLLTVTETSRGLNFEYKWEEPRAEQPYCSSSTSGALGQGNPHYQDLYYTSRASPPSSPCGVAPSGGSEYYVRLQESASRSGSSYWSTAGNIRSDGSDSDSSPAQQVRISHPTENLQGAPQSSPSLGFCDPYLEANTLTGSCRKLLDPLRKSFPIIGHVDVEGDDGLLLGGRGGAEEALLSDGEPNNWISNRSANNNSLEPLRPGAAERWTLRGNDGGRLDSYIQMCHREKTESPPAERRSVWEGLYSERVRDPHSCLVDLGDFSEDDNDDAADLTSGIFADFNLDYTETEEEELSPKKANPEGFPDPGETARPDLADLPILPKSLDSGYDTENNESPEFLFKELGELVCGEADPHSKNPYRDSAYFSDPERSPQEDRGEFFVCGWSSAGVRPAFSVLAPFPPQMGGCLTKEAGPAEEDLETEPSGDEPASEIGSEASGAQVETPSANQEVDSSVQSLQTGEDGNEEAELKTNQEDFEDIDADESSGEDSGGRDLSASSSLLELCGEDVRAPLEEAEGEDDSDDSESDEEPVTYDVQNGESEEEEEPAAVPVVVSDCSRAEHLRSLLKMPTLSDELDRKKKAVSFFDDVTVFLFDQESPTGELADYSLPAEPESKVQESSDPGPNPHASVSMETDGNDKGGNHDPVFDLAPSSPPDSPEPPSSPKAVVAAPNRFTVSRFSITHVSDAPAAENREDDLTV